jgi:lysophospholipase L1-like esterase
VVWFGANDAADNARQGAKVDAYARDLAAIVRLLAGSGDSGDTGDGTSGAQAQSQHQTQSQSRVSGSLAPAASGPHRVLVVTPPPVFGAAGRTPERTALYAEAAVRVARDTGAACLDLHREMTSLDYSSGHSAAADSSPDSCLGSSCAEAALAQPPAWRHLLADDGLHLSEPGQRFVSARVAAAIAIAWPDLAPEAVPMALPHHSAVEVADLAACFAYVYHPPPGGFFCIFLRPFRGFPMMHSNSAHSDSVWTTVLLVN